MSTKSIYVCDQCNAEHSTAQIAFHNGVRVHIGGTSKFQRDRLDFCSIKCLAAFFTKQVLGK